MLKITNKKRFCGTVAAALIATVCITAAATCGTASPEKGTYKEYAVKPGDTLWSIAAEHCPKGTDKRRYIFEITELNQIESCIIRCGDTIKLK